MCIISDTTNGKSEADSEISSLNLDICTLKELRRERARSKTNDLQPVRDRLSLSLLCRGRTYPSVLHADYIL